MKNISIFYNSNAQYLLRIYGEKREKYLSENIQKEPSEIMEEIKNEIK